MNFDTTSQALTTVFSLLVGEDWPKIMFNYVRIYEESSGRTVQLYFVLLLLIGNFILLSLFASILIENFEEEQDSQDVENNSEGASPHKTPEKTPEPPTPDPFNEE
jgi:hypothetical protein